MSPISPRFPTRLICSATPGTKYISDGPGAITVNQTIYRNFAIRERANLQFRWELFNVLNHANFQLPIDTVNAVNAATLTSVITPGRQMQFGLRLTF